jgi:methionyl-tRNA formyltransferase
VIEGQMPPGHIRNELVVGCGAGALQILELQRAGGRRLSAREFLRGHPLRPGARFA